MAILFDTAQRIVPTWLAAARRLERSDGRCGLNLLLEIADPVTVTAEDRALMRQVDVALRGAGKRPLNTVAATIFPQDYYRRHQRPAFYDRFTAMMARGKEPNRWGTYALRMIERRGQRPGEVINPLEKIVERMSDAGQPQAGSYQNAYEMGIVVPEDDYALEHEDVGGELPTYAVEKDGNRWYGFPCLSHLTFKRVPQRDGFAVNLTAVYRSHTYCERALGNLIGLAQLQSFVATEAKLQLGTLSCLSSHAELDVAAWGGLPAARSLLASAP